jgi:hypothetical protein
MELTLLQDSRLMSAVSRIIQRSERQESNQKLVETYVDVGLLPQLNNTNHQIFYGRRGTGKTHVMKVLESTLKSDLGHNIDCRTLGSTSQFSDPTVPLTRRCLALFRDFLLEIYHGLLEHIVEEPSKYANEALEEADSLLSLITEPLRVFKANKLTTQGEQSSTAKKVLSISGDSSQSLYTTRLNVVGESGSSQSESQETQYSIDTEDKIIFPELQRHLRKVLDLADTRLFILVDEWSSGLP